MRISRKLFLLGWIMIGFQIVSIGMHENYLNLLFTVAAMSSFIIAIGFAQDETKEGVKE